VKKKVPEVFLQERYIVLYDGQPITVEGKYHWNQSEARDVENNLKQKIMDKMEETSSAFKGALLESQLESIMIKQVVFN